MAAEDNAAPGPDQEGGVPRYRVFFINPTPRHVTGKVEFEASDDHAAHAHVTAMADGRAMELWQEDRLIRAYPGEGRPARG